MEEGRYGVDIKEMNFKNGFFSHNNQASVSIKSSTNIPRKRNVTVIFTKDSQINF